MTVVTSLFRVERRRRGPSGRWAPATGRFQETVVGSIKRRLVCSRERENARLLVVRLDEAASIRLRFVSRCAQQRGHAQVGIERDEQNGGGTFV